MKFPRLTDENFLMYAIKCYNNPNCTSVDEFKKDMKGFAYISKALSKISSGSALPNVKNVRQLLNHIISLSNLFGNRQTARMLFFYYPEKHHPCIKTALDFLDRLPDTKMDVYPEIRAADFVPWDERLVKVLEEDFDAK